ncbi:uncharacterized protein PgNI_11952 [Pyricularia grisea]|uniref:TLDc domain-containing protein n=1 Tax=Pyricularia grisea TaxID=148305 RepID=A0A6P8AQL8_PYRGI|nr:uncharacterized protein PgNI_11952 [Pyricularia grisea]TLD04370.1 hypothetical protein PgNI_11952 [Pyricularia grisea]
MLSSLDNLIQSIAFGHARRDVKRYLDAATRTSVRHELTEKLALQLGFKEREHLRSTFDQHAIDVSGRKRWTEQSLRNQIRSNYEDTIISENAIRLLWGSFLFYADHPFSPPPCPQPQDALVDFEQFKLAVLLTVFRCDKMLGTLDDANVYWREDGALCNRQSGFDRMFSSLVYNVSESDSEKSEQNNEGYSSALNDIMDVLIMAAPAHIHSLPTAQQLQPTAQRLVASKGGIPAVQRGHVAGRSEVHTLMDLLLRLRVYERANKWRHGLSLHHGDFLEANSRDLGLTEALVNTLMGTDRIDGTMPVRQISDAAVRLMPNLLLRFQELWGVLFHPSEDTKEKKPPAREFRFSQLGAVISLFAPTIQTSSGSNQDQKEESQFILQASAQTNFDNRDDAMKRVLEAISGNFSGHVILFTTSAEKRSSKTVIGGYFPCPEKGLPHFLFQLQPILRVFRSRRLGIPVNKLFKSKEERGMEYREATPSIGYWIGDSAGALSTGIRVDPDTTATLLLGEGGYYMDMAASRVKNDEGWKTQQVVVQDAMMEVYVVTNTDVADGAGDKQTE